MTATIEPTDADFLNPAQWMSPKEFAGILGVRVQTIYNMTSTGQDMPASYPISARLTRFYRPEVVEWMRKRRRVSAAVQIKKPRSRARNAQLRRQPA
jgi:predicted DNA-binding transcriptional regulator AlpA